MLCRARKVLRSPDIWSNPARLIANRHFQTFFLLLAIAPAHDAFAQPGSTACRDAKAFADKIAERISELTDHPGTYGGKGSPGYKQQLSTLKLSAEANAIHEKQVCAEPEPPKLAGNIQPYYQVLALLYAPPGYLGTPGQNGAAPSIADYASESKTGTTTSTAKSFKNSNTITATVTADVFGQGTSLGFSVESSNAKQKSSSMEITKDAKSDLKVPGPPTDGIDHGYDEIWLGLNPVVNFVAQGSAISWSLGTTSGQLLEQYVYVSWLRDWIANPSHAATHPVGSQLQARGFTTQDFKNILSLDPFANGSPDLGSTRFTELSTTFPYEPPVVPNQQSTPLQTFSISNESKSTHGTTDTAEAQQSITVSAKASGPGVAVAMSFQNQLTWTYEKSRSRSADGTQFVSVSIGTPSSSYTAPLTTIALYWDNLWSSFAFVPISLATADSFSGTITDPSGNPVAGQLVTVEADGVRMRTYTGVTGRYAFSKKELSALRPATVSAGGVRKELTFDRGQSLINLVVPKLP